MGDRGPELDYKPHLPPRTDYGIGIVGCGGIINDASLPAYAAHKLNVAGCYDLDREKAESTARKFSIPKVYDTLNDLLADPAVEIVEIAVHPWQQFEVACQAIAAGKHLLCQKPLSDSFAQAVETVRLARAAGVKLAVNQQMRWDPAIRAVYDLFDKGWLGQPTEASIQVSLGFELEGSWGATSPRFEVMLHSIHYLDSFRFLFGEPEWVTSRHARHPLLENVRGETKTITVLDYASGLQALSAVDLAGPGFDPFVTFRFSGTEGVAYGNIGLLSYPQGEPDTLAWRSTKLPSDAHSEAKLEGAWFPDAFIGPVASLMQAIQEDGSPQTDGADHLKTLGIVEAAYVSASENRSVQPSEVG